MNSPLLKSLAEHGYRAVRIDTLTIEHSCPQVVDISVIFSIVAAVLSTAAIPCLFDIVGIEYFLAPAVENGHFKLNDSFSIDLEKVIDSIVVR